MEKLESVSISNNTVKRRIKEISVDITDQVIGEVRPSKFGFAIQLDESTDVTNDCQLLFYVRFTQNDVAKTELLLSHEVSTTTKAKGIFNILDNFFKKNALHWIGESLLNARQMGLPLCLVESLGFKPILKLCQQTSKLFICFTHRFALCAKLLPAKLLICLNRVVKIVNFVKMSVLTLERPEKNIHL